MQRLTAARRDRVDVTAHQARRKIEQIRPGLFEHLPSRRIVSRIVLCFDMPARQQPPAEAAMMNQQNGVA